MSAHNAETRAGFWPMIDKLIAAHAKFCCYGRERLCPYHEGMVAGLTIALKASEAALDRVHWFDGCDRYVLNPEGTGCVCGRQYSEHFDGTHNEGGGSVGA